MGWGLLVILSWGGGRCLLSGGYCLYYLGEGAGVY